MEIDFSKIRIGDRLVRTKGGYFSKHHVLYMGFWDNQHLIAENQVGHGVRYLALNQFLKEGQLKRVEYYNHNENIQTQIIDRVNKTVGKRYSLFTYNCEHFVNDILSGTPQSMQIGNLVFAAVGVTLCMLAFNSSSEKK